MACGGRFRVRLVAVGVEGPVNLGYLARLADNFDVDEFYLVKPAASPSIARRFAAKAAHRLESAIVVESLKEALEGTSLSVCTSAVARGGDPVRVSVPPRQAALLAGAHGGTVALVVGRESTGLTREEIALCDVLSSIPSSPAYPALNLSNATAIYLYELHIARACADAWRVLAGDATPAGAPRLRLIEEYAARLADALGLPGDTGLALRRVAARAAATDAEVSRIVRLLSRAAARLARHGGCE